MEVEGVGVHGTSRLHRCSMPQKRPRTFSDIQCCRGRCHTAKSMKSQGRVLYPSPVFLALLCALMHTFSSLFFRTNALLG